jgi:AcrR family transcriptional regulator
MPRPPTASSPPVSAAGDLRRRRRLRTKAQLQDEALALFVAKGYEQTSIEDIAHAAAVSPRTFYRYFTSKEDTVLWAEHEDLPPDALWGTEPPEDPYTLLVMQLRELTLRMYRDNPERLLLRTRLSHTVPQIRLHLLDQHFNVLGAHYTQFAEATGLAPDDLRQQVRLGSAIVALLVAMEHWQRTDGREPLPDLIDEALAALTATA